MPRPRKTQVVMLIGRYAGHVMDMLQHEAQAAFDNGTARLATPEEVTEYQRADGGLIDIKTVQEAASTATDSSNTNTVRDGLQAAEGHADYMGMPWAKAKPILVEAIDTDATKKADIIAAAIDAGALLEVGE